MADIVETVLEDVSEAASVIAWIYPPAAGIAKIAHYAAEGEHEAVSLWNMIVAHKATGAADLLPEHENAIVMVAAAIDARRAPQGRGGR